MIRQKPKFLLVLLLTATMLCLTACRQQPAQGKDVAAPVVAPVSTLVTHPETGPAPGTEHKTSSTNHPALSPDVTVSLTCTEHPEMQYPGGYSVAPGVKHITLVFSRDVNRDEVEAIVQQSGDAVECIWWSDHELELIVDLKEQDFILFFYVIQDYGFALKPVTEKPLWLVTAPSSAVEVASVTSDTVSIQLSPDRETLVYIDRIVEPPTHTDGDVFVLPGKMKVADLATGRITSIPLRVYTTSMGNGAAGAGSPFWVQPPNAFLTVNDGSVGVMDGDADDRLAHLIRRDGSLEPYRLGISKKTRIYGASSYADRLAVVTSGSNRTMTITNGTSSSTGVPISVRLYSGDGKFVREYPDIAWRSTYWNYKPRRDDIYLSPDGKRLVLIGVLPEADSKSAHRAISLDLDTGEVTAGHEGSRLSAAGFIWDGKMVGPDGKYLAEQHDCGWEFRWSPTGTAAAYLDANNHLRVWDLVTGESTVWFDKTIRLLGPWGVNGILVVQE